MSTCRSRRIVCGGALTLLAGGLVLGTAGGASAQFAEPEGVAAMSSPYIPNVPHVPANVFLALDWSGSSDGARYIGPDGSLFNGPVDEVDRRVDAWWAEQMAAGTTPAEADRLLARPTW